MDRGGFQGNVFMKLKCPDCGSAIDIERLQEEGVFREIIGIYKGLPPAESYLIEEYIECFRASRHAEMPEKKYLRILKEVDSLLRAGAFIYDKNTYHVDRDLALEAMQKTVDTEKRAFKNHNYWKVIMIGMLKKRGAIEEQQTADSRRQTAEKRGPSEPQRVRMPDWVKEKVGI